MSVTKMTILDVFYEFNSLDWNEGILKDEGASFKVTFSSIMTEKKWKS